MNIFIYGASAQAKNIIEVVENDQLFDIDFCYTDFEKTLCMGFEVISGQKGLDDRLNKIADESFGFIVAIGNPRGRERVSISRRLIERDLIPASIISKHAYLSCRSKIGYGLQLMPGAIVMSDCNIGDFVILNPKSSVAHDCFIHDGCELSTGATLAGNVTLMENVWIGAGVTVMPRLTIGENSIIGAGAVVTRNIPPNSVCAGVPCRVIRARGLHE